MILAIGNTKGGVGKTTIAVNFAAYYASKGKKVWVVDGDAQGSTHVALGTRQNGPPCALNHVTDGKVLLKQIKAHSADYDLVVIDVGGRDSSCLRAALLCADVFLVPFAPRSLDVRSLRDIAKLVVEAQVHNPKMQALAFLNMADNAGTDNDDAAEAAAGIDGLEYLNAPVRRRKSIATAAGQGLCVSELRPRDKKAEAEIQALIKAVESVV